MNGIGEQFGRSVDAVLRRPRGALVPLLVDAVVLLVGTALFLSLSGFLIQFPQGYRLPNFPVAVPHALPTVGDILGPTPALHELPRQVIVAALILIALAIPLLAFAEAGFLGVLRAIYLKPIDPIQEGRHADAWSRIRESFVATGRKHFGAFLLLRSIQAALAVAALFLPILLPRFGNYGLGVLAVDVLLLWAPYAVIEHEGNPVRAIRESVALVADHLATTLVALLFGFLLTGGMAILVSPLSAYLPEWAPFVAAVLYAPVGTALSLFLYRVYLGFYPEESLPESAPVPTTVPAAG